MNTASGIENRTLAVFQGRNDLTDLHRIAIVGRLIGSQIYFFRPFKFPYFLHLNIKRDIDQYGTSSPGRGNIKRLFENTRNIGCLPHQITVFHKALCRTGNIRFLEYVTADQVTVYLTGNTYQRNTVHICRCDSGDQVCGTGTARTNADSGFAGDPRFTGCRMCRIRFGTDKHRMDIRIDQTVIYRTDRDSGISIYRCHSLQFETFCDCICTVHSCLL